MPIFQLFLQISEICFQKVIVQYITFKTAVLYKGCSKWIAYCPLARYPRGARKNQYIPV